jgi:ATP-dependent DNA helicase HFM1/MER3
VDLAEQLSPIPYSKLAPLEYRKLHKLHASVQKNKSEPSVRLPKQKPQFSYASDSEPDLPFLRKPKAKGGGDILGTGETDGEDDLPSPSAIAAFWKGDSDEPFEPGNVNHEEALRTSTVMYDEAGMLDLDESIPLQPPTPKVDSSFANGVFDFDAFNEKYGEPVVYSSPLMSAARKRERSPSPPLPEKRHRRVKGEETKSGPSMRSSEQQESTAAPDSPVIKGPKIKIDDLINENSQPNAEQHTQQRAVPAWVGEFDADLIESLMGIVDFVE